MRRLVAVIALVSSSLVAFSVPVPVRAAHIASEPELIARKLATQTTGPSGFLAPNDVIPWGLDRIDSRTGRDNSFTYSTDGTGVKAYIVDSGVNAVHAEFSSRVLPGWSYRSNASALASYNNAINAYNANPAVGIPPCAYNSNIHQFVPATFDGASDGSDVGRVDNDGHGTHVAGTIGGLTTGVAKAASIVPVRVLDSCGAGTATMVLSGLNWILADHQLGEKAVVNMSIGFESTATSIDTAIKSLLAEGIVVVAASGNEGGSACGITPAGTQGTISVGASNYLDGEPYFTNFGECVDIFAPGQSIVSSWPKDLSAPTLYRGVTGTSMAAPHVAGAVARFLQSATVTATTPTDAWNWLKTNATCNAITYYKSSATDTSRAAIVKTPNRLLAVEAPATVPCAPNGVTAAVANKSSVVAWEEVPAANGSVITAYTATATPGGKSCTVLSGTTCTITGLVNNTAYTIAVAATNGVGVGTSSNTVAITPVGPPGAVTGLVAATQKNALAVSWVQAEGDGAGITYTATATPGGSTCTSTETAMTSCTITGLVNGANYTVSVVGTNTYGTGIATTATGLADGAPDVPASSMSVVGSKSVTIAWPAITTSIGVTYVVTSSPGNLTCSSTETSCVVTGLKNGVNYTFTITTKTATGQVAAAGIQLAARPGFTVKKSIVKKRSTTRLSWLISSLSTGKKTWSETGPCSISGTKLKAPKASASCVVTLKVAKKGKYPAMSTKLRVAVE